MPHKAQWTGSNWSTGDITARLGQLFHLPPNLNTVFCSKGQGIAGNRTLDFTSLAVGASNLSVDPLMDPRIRRQLQGLNTGGNLLFGVALMSALSEIIGACLKWNGERECKRHS